MRARRFVIATGASPIVPNLPGLFSVPWFTTETIFDNTRKLTHLVVIGAGPMGLELALSYRRLGADGHRASSRITRRCPTLDPELVEIALRRLRDEGVPCCASGSSWSPSTPAARASASTSEPGEEAQHARCSPHPSSRPDAPPISPTSNPGCTAKIRRDEIRCRRALADAVAADHESEASTPSVKLPATRPRRTLRRSKPTFVVRCCAAASPARALR